MSRSNKSTRPLLTLALTVFIMLAMLAPVAVAAPEWAHGIVINAPTSGDPAFVNPDADNNSVGIDYTVQIVGTQVDDVWVKFKLFDAYNNVVAWDKVVIQAADLATGDNNFTFDLVVGPTDNGWYSLKVCVMDRDWDRELFCDTAENAVLVDNEPPWVKLIKPAHDAWITGENYLLVGEAWDEWDLDEGSVVFQYCVISNWRAPEGWCGPTDEDWIFIAQGVPTPGVPGQYEARWDTTQVPDDYGMVRICASDMVGLTSCDAHKVRVENRYTIQLRPGWNLISTPLVPYDTDIESVMLHLIAHNSVKQVMTYDRPSGTWHIWTPSPADPPDLTTFEDGKGYWIVMAAVDELTIVGTWSEGMPPTYPVYEDWNLIGYTHWGQPTHWSFPDKTVLDYLGLPLLDTVEALWRYDAYHEVWVAMYGWDDMVKGAGFWLATSEDGTINP